MSKSKILKKNKVVIDIQDPLAGDLTDFISSSDWALTKFELSEKKDKVLNLRLSEKLLNEIKKQAKRAGIDTQKFVRILLESSIRRKAG